MRWRPGAFLALVPLLAAIALGCGDGGGAPSPTASPTVAPATPSPTPVASPTRTATRAPTPTVTASPTPTATPSPTPTATPSPSPTATPTATPSPTPPPTPTATPDANAGLLDILETLRGRNRAPARYNRDDFGYPADLDDDCIDTRHEVLIEEATGPVELDDECYVAEGEWYDPFTDQTFTSPRDLQVDHVVALADAWYSGAWAWSEEERAEFANDPANLNAIDGEENQRKSAWGPADYTPANEAHRCAYLEQYARVKVQWGLAITQRDFKALEEGLTACAIAGETAE